MSYKFKSKAKYKIYAVFTSHHFKSFDFTVKNDINRRLLRSRQLGAGAGHKAGGPTKVTFGDSG